MSCCFISCLTCLRRSTSFLISFGKIPISRSESGISGISSDSSSCRVEAAITNNKFTTVFLDKRLKR